VRPKFWPARRCPPIRKSDRRFPQLRRTATAAASQSRIGMMTTSSWHVRFSTMPTRSAGGNPALVWRKGAKRCGGLDCWLRTHIHSLTVEAGVGCNRQLRAAVRHLLGHWRRRRRARDIGFVQGHAMELCVPLGTSGRSLSYSRNPTRFSSPARSDAATACMAPRTSSSRSPNARAM
jgi:hypothetical protein